MNPPQLEHRVSSGSQSDGLDFFQEDGLLDSNVLGDWHQGEYFDERLLLPAHSADHEKHFLPQLERDEAENKRQELSLDAAGKKKPGRKPILNEPTTKRKAQNRAAQRAFRERKENHVKELETRVQELEQQNQHATSENEALKAEIARLRGGSITADFARNEDFTFAFANPIIPTTTRHQSSSSGSGYSPSSDITGTTRPSDCPSLSSSQTSPQSVIEGDFNAAAMPFFSSSSSSTFTTSSQQTPSSTSDGSGATAASSKLFSSSSNSSTSQPSALQMQAAQPQVQQLFSDPYSLSNSHRAFSFEAMAYRDKGIFDNYYDDVALFDTSSGFIDPGHVDSELDMFLPPALDVKLEQQLLPLQQKTGPVVTSPPLSPVRAADAAAAATAHNEPNLVALEDKVEREKIEVGCEVVWEKITTHPKFPIFDLDDLCTEFKQKATCSRGPIAISQSDWEHFDQQLDNFAARQEQKLLTS